MINQTRPENRALLTWVSTAKGVVGLEAPVTPWIYFERFGNPQQKAGHRYSWRGSFFHLLMKLKSIEVS